MAESSSIDGRDRNLCYWSKGLGHCSQRLPKIFRFRPRASTRPAAPQSIFQEMLPQPSDNEDEVGWNNIVDNNSSMKEITHVDRIDTNNKNKKNRRNYSRHRKMQDRKKKEKDKIKDDLYQDRKASQGRV